MEGESITVTCKEGDKFKISKAAALNSGYLAGLIETAEASGEEMELPISR